MDLFYITVSMPGHLPMPSKCPPKAITNKQTNKQTHTEGYLLSVEIVMDRGLHRAKSLLRIGLFQDNHKQSLKLACTLKPSSEYNFPFKNLKNI